MLCLKQLHAHVTLVESLSLSFVFWSCENETMLGVYQLATVE